MRAIPDFPVMSEEHAAFWRSKTPAERVQIAIELTQQRRAMMATHLRKRHPHWNDQRVQYEAGFRYLGKSDSLPPEHALVSAMRRCQRRPDESRFARACQLAGTVKRDSSLLAVWVKNLDVEDVWQAVLHRLQNGKTA